MYRDLGMRDRLLVHFFGWVTGIRLLNPTKGRVEEEEGVRGAMSAYIPLMEESDTIH